MYKINFSSFLYTKLHTETKLTMSVDKYHGLCGYSEYNLIDHKMTATCLIV